MAYDPDQSTPATGDAAMRRIKDLLVASTMWSVVASGDGASAYGSSSDVLTADSGANSFANYTNGSSSAWCRLRMTGTTRELLIIRGSASTTWTVKYSLLGFSGGSPSATAAPTATDSQTKHSAAQLFPADGTYQLSVCAENAAPGYFTASCRLTAAGLAAQTIFGLWPLRTGSYPSTPVADADPYVVATWYANPIVTASLTTFGQMMGAWSRPGLSSATWCSAVANVDSTYGAAGALHAIDSSELAPDIVVQMIASGPVHYGPKGVLRDVRLCLSSTTNTPNGSHLVDGSDYFVRCGPVWLRWTSSVPT